MRRLGLLGVLLFAGCSAAPAGTPVVIYVTLPPATVAPTVAVTPSPTAKATPTAGTHDLVIALTLYGDYHDIGTYQGRCFGHEGYDDIESGMQATVRDAHGTVIGLATFNEDGTPDDPDVPRECAFVAVAHGVPDADIYSIEVGRRGSIQFTRADFAANGWKAELSLGS